MGAKNRSFKLHVVGVTHQNDNGTKRQSVLRDCDEGEGLKLSPEPENKFDKNAIRVCRKNGDQIGYIDAPNAYRLTSDMASGWSYGARVDKILHEPHTRSYGMIIRLDVLTTSKGRNRAPASLSIPRERNPVASAIAWAILASVPMSIIAVIVYVFVR